MLTVDDLTVIYPGAERPALNRVSLSVLPGEIHSLVGANGAGKSTLMGSVIGLTPLHAGEIRLDGISLPDSLDQRRRVGHAAQTEALYPLLSGLENLRFFGRLAGLRRAALTQRIRDLSSALSLDDFVDQPVRQLSQGERRRIHVAAALLGRFDLIMLDEPTASVDPRTRSDLLSLIRQTADNGAAILYSTHYLTEIEGLGGAVSILDDGVCVAHGTVEQLLGRHGRSTIEIGLGIEPNVSNLPWDHEWTGELLRVWVQDPSDDLPRVLERLSVDVRDLRSLRVRRPTLDAVFFDLTNRSTESLDGEE